MIDRQKLIKSVRRVVELLARREYDQIEELTSGHRLSAEELATVVDDYGRTLLLPPPDEDLVRSVVEVAGASPPEWSIYADLWTREEGRSDLTLELRAFDDGEPEYRLEIDDLHVL